MTDQLFTPETSFSPDAASFRIGRLDALALRIAGLVLGTILPLVIFHFFA